MQLQQQPDTVQGFFLAPRRNFENIIWANNMFSVLQNCEKAENS